MKKRILHALPTFPRSPKRSWRSLTSPGDKQCLPSYPWREKKKKEEIISLRRVGSIAHGSCRGEDPISCSKPPREGQCKQGHRPEHIIYQQGGDQVKVTQGSTDTRRRTYSYSYNKEAEKEEKKEAGGWGWNLRLQPRSRFAETDTRRLRDTCCGRSLCRAPYLYRMHLCGLRRTYEYYLYKYASDAAPRAGDSRRINLNRSEEFWGMGKRAGHVCTHARHS